MVDKEMLEAVRAIMKEELEPVKKDICKLFLFHGVGLSDAQHFRKGLTLILCVAPFGKVL